MIIDLGNVWEALSAIGTIAVVIVSLYLARRDYRKKLEVDYWTSYKIFSGEKISLWSIDLVNIGSVPVKIYEVGLYQKSWLRKRRKKIIFMMPRDFEYESYKFDRMFKYSYNFGLANSPRQKGNSNDETKYPSKLPTSSLHGHYNWFQIFDWFN